MPLTSAGSIPLADRGGGNITLMVNKLAPRTFAAAIDMSGMARLTDDIAFNLPGGQPPERAL